MHVLSYSPRIIYLFVFLISALFLFPQTHQNKDTVLTSLQKLPDDTVKLRVLEELAIELGENYPDSAQKFALQAEKIAVQLKNKRQLSIVAELMGLTSYYKGQFDSGLFYFQKSLDLKKEIGWKRGLGTVLNSMGSMYTAKGEYEKAVNSFFEALKNSDQFEGSRLKGSINNNLGLCFQQMGELDKALTYFHRSIEAENPEKTGFDVSSTEMNIAIIYSLKKNYPEASRIFNSLLKKYEKEGNLHGISQCCNNLSSLYMDMKKYDLGLVYGLKAMNIKIALKDEKGLPGVYNNVGTIYFFKKAFKDAIRYHELSREVSSRLHLNNDLVFALRSLSEDLEAVGDDHGALAYYKQYVSLRDTVFNGQKNEKINAIQVRYETEKKDKEIFKATAELREKRFEARQKEMQRNAFIAGSVLMAALAVLVFRSYRQKQKANVEISRQKQIIEEKNKEVMDSIRYAKRIQSSLLPTEKYLDKNLGKKSDIANS